jgi:hypothetical protein
VEGARDGVKFGGFFQSRFRREFGGIRALNLENGKLSEQNASDETIFPPPGKTAKKSRPARIWPGNSCRKTKIMGKAEKNEKSS